MSTVNDDVTIHMLQIAASDMPRPISDLRARLRCPDGRMWLERELERVLLPERLVPADLLEGRAPIDALRRAKTRTNQLARSGLSVYDRLAALAAHDMIVAAALLHHGVLVSQRTRAEWDDRLVELSADAPEPWRRLLRDAADSESAPT